MEKLAVSIAEAAQMVGLSTVKLSQYIKSGELPSLKLGAQEV